MKATQVVNQIESIKSMSGDQLSIIQAIIPYLQARQQAAIDFLDSESPLALDYIKEVNKEISKILSLQV